MFTLRKPFQKGELIEYQKDPRLQRIITEVYPPKQWAEAENEHDYVTYEWGYPDLLDDPNKRFLSINSNDPELLWWNKALIITLI